MKRLIREFAKWGVDKHRVEEDGVVFFPCNTCMVKVNKKTHLCKMALAPRRMQDVDEVNDFLHIMDTGMRIVVYNDILPSPPLLALFRANESVPCVAVCNQILFPVNFFRGGNTNDLAALLSQWPLHVARNPREGVIDHSLRTTPIFFPDLYFSNIDFFRLSHPYATGGATQRQECDITLFDLFCELGRDKRFSFYYFPTKIRAEDTVRNVFSICLDEGVGAFYVRTSAPKMHSCAITDSVTEALLRLASAPVVFSAIFRSMRVDQTVFPAQKGVLSALVVSREAAVYLWMLRILLQCSVGGALDDAKHTLRKFIRGAPLPPFFDALLA